MPDRPKRVAAIHDLSGFGRCSLSVILPTLSVMGVQGVPGPHRRLCAPTPGGMGPVQRRDLTDYTAALPGALPAAGTGHLNVSTAGFSAPSSRSTTAWPSSGPTHEDAFTVVDPVMGRPRQSPTATYHPRHARAAWRSWWQVADLITPNLTEACMLLKLPHIHRGPSPAPRPRACWCA